MLRFHRFPLQFPRSIRKIKEDFYVKNPAFSYPTGTQDDIRKSLLKHCEFQQFRGLPFKDMTGWYNPFMEQQETLAAYEGMVETSVKGNDYIIRKMYTQEIPVLMATKKGISSLMPDLLGFSFRNPVPLQKYREVFDKGLGRAIITDGGQDLGLVSIIRRGPHAVHSDLLDNCALLHNLDHHKTECFQLIAEEAIRIKVISSSAEKDKLADIFDVIHFYCSSLRYQIVDADPHYIVQIGKEVNENNSNMIITLPKNKAVIKIKDLTLLPHHLPLKYHVTDLVALDLARILDDTQF